MDLNPSTSTYQLCNLGQVAEPLSPGHIFLIDRMTAAVWKNGGEPLSEGEDHLREQPDYPAAGPPGPGNHCGSEG